MAATERVREPFEYIYGNEDLYRSAHTYPGKEKEADRVKRTRERPKAAEPARSNTQSLTASELRQILCVAVFVAVLLIGILVLNAYAANIQCSINSLTRENLELEDEIDVLNMKIDQNTSIEQIEAYAIDELKMRYPKSNQCIFIEEDVQLMDNFSRIIRQKAYEK